MTELIVDLCGIVFGLEILAIGIFMLKGGITGIYSIIPAILLTILTFGFGIWLMKIIIEDMIK